MISTSNDKCTGCSACICICPKEAINICKDEYGFTLPKVNFKKCIKCNLCNKVCPVNKNKDFIEEPKVYAAINKNKNKLNYSSSGGVFPAIASYVLDNNGVICGCAWSENMNAKHIFIDKYEELIKLQGSKYVQSDVGKTFIEVKKYLEKGIYVLYTGTPCQISGLKSYLNKSYEKLITIDLICHGVPNNDFFKGYINSLQNKIGGKITNFTFRDKRKGWRFIGNITYEKNGIKKEKSIIPLESYYYNYFAKGYIYRESCYSCEYAGKSRIGDFTIGDYWGIEKYHSKIDTKNGVSILMVNTKKAKSLITYLEEKLYLEESKFELARRNNSQLNRPMEKNKKRDEILEKWKQGGSELVEQSYNISLREQIMNIIKNILPHGIKKKLRQYTSR